MENWRDCEQLDVQINKTLHHQLDPYIHKPLHTFLYKASSLIFNLQSKTRAFIVGEKHYDLGHDLFEVMLGETMANCFFQQLPTKI